MIHAFLEFLRSLTNPDKLLELLHTVFTGWLGYALLFAVVFSETGLLVGFFLPGDSLMFTIGVVAGAAVVAPHVVKAQAPPGGPVGPPSTVTSPHATLALKGRQPPISPTRTF